MTDPVPSKDLVSQLRGLTAGARLLGYTAAEHIERLEIALRGIQSCSTCEACRGAATLALGGFTCLGGCGVEVPSKDGYCSACFIKARAEQRAAREPAVDDVEQRARAHFIEVHGIPAHDPWDHAASATKEQYRKWARDNTPPPGDVS